jgi:hypothetical protein
MYYFIYQVYNISYLLLYNVLINEDECLLLSNDSTPYMIW